ncbi:MULTISPECIES: hypothetical protein [Acinetobacter]|uniref:hypothetical protein n=1 Tax=Acinetobacter TaxID=469 RepID=UPI001428CB02|nr:MULTISPECIES: hypothetical protein [Acinetobacter]
MKKVFVVISMMMALTACQNIQKTNEVTKDTNSHVVSQEVAACTNGFDSVDVCKLLS